MNKSKLRIKWKVIRDCMKDAGCCMMDDGWWMMMFNMDHYASHWNQSFSLACPIKGISIFFPSFFWLSLRMNWFFSRRNQNQESILSCCWMLQGTKIEIYNYNYSIDSNNNTIHSKLVFIQFNVSWMPWKSPTRPFPFISDKIYFSIHKISMKIWILYNNALGL